MSKTGALNWWKPALCGVSMMLYASALSASPVARLDREGVVILLYNDACALTEQITNLPKRAVWTEKGKDTEGCFGINYQTGMVTLYFADKTAATIPAQFFTAVTGA